MNKLISVKQTMNKSRKTTRQLKKSRKRSSSDNKLTHTQKIKSKFLSSLITIELRYKMVKYHQKELRLTLMMLSTQINFHLKFHWLEQLMLMVLSKH